MSMSAAPAEVSTLPTSCGVQVPPAQSAPRSRVRSSSLIRLVRYSVPSPSQAICTTLLLNPVGSSPRQVSARVSRSSSDTEAGLRRPIATSSFEPGQTVMAKIRDEQVKVVRSSASRVARSMR